MCKLDNETIKYLANGVYATAVVVCTTIAGKVTFDGMVKLFTHEVIIEENGKKTTIHGMDAKSIVGSMKGKL